MTQSDFRQCQPGEIYSFKEPLPNARHPFAIVGRFDDDYYLGCMITHSNPDRYPDNAPMEFGDFEQEFDNDKQATIIYSEKRGVGSHFVKAALFKEVDQAVVWSGQLSPQGLAKMYRVVEGLNPEMWHQYNANSNERLKANKGKR